MGASVAGGTYGLPSGPAVAARYEAEGGLVPQGISAEMIAEKWELRRDELDAYGLRSQQYARARHQGRPLREPDPAHRRRRRHAP